MFKVIETYEEAQAACSAGVLWYKYSHWHTYKPDNNQEYWNIHSRDQWTQEIKGGITYAVYLED